MKRTYLVSILIVVIFTLCYLSLTSKDNTNESHIWTPLTEENRDYFYEETELDRLRVPLIKPYEILKDIDPLEINKILGWSIDLNVSPSDKEIYYYLNIHAVEKIAVENQVIMVHSSYLEDVDTQAGQKVLYWFVIVPSQKIETGFESEREFLDYTHLLGIQTPIWFTPDNAYKQFVETRCLDWIPNCN